MNIKTDITGKMLRYEVRGGGESLLSEGYYRDGDAIVKEFPLNVPIMCPRRFG